MVAPPVADQPAPEPGWLPCGNCGRPWAEHCRTHAIPCCPGYCPGSADPPEVGDPDEEGDDG